MKNINTNYKDMMTKFLLNTVLQHVDMLLIIGIHQQLEYDI